MTHGDGKCLQAKHQEAVPICRGENSCSSARVSPQVTHLELQAWVAQCLPMMSEKRTQKALSSWRGRAWLRASIPMCQQDAQVWLRNINKIYLIESVHTPTGQPTSPNRFALCFSTGPIACTIVAWLSAATGTGTHRDSPCAPAHT